jgi:hypothetical protein
LSFSLSIVLFKGTFADDGKVCNYQYSIQEEQGRSEVEKEEDVRHYE